MAAPATADVRPFLSTRTGAVVMAAAVMIAGSTVFVAVGTPEVKIGVVLITVTHTTTDTQSGEAALPVEMLSLAHCAPASFSENTKTLTVWAPNLPAAVKNAVLVRYTNGGSFSGGGDDTQVFFLRQGEKATIGGAFSAGHPLYEITPGAADPVVTVNADETAPNTWDARYVVNGTFNTWTRWGEEGWRSVVQEHHHAEAFGGVRVENRGQQMCM